MMMNRRNGAQEAVGFSPGRVTIIPIQSLKAGQFPKEEAGPNIIRVGGAVGTGTEAKDTL
jgi:hypothetical protein